MGLSLVAFGAAAAGENMKPPERLAARTAMITVRPMTGMTTRVLRSNMKPLAKCVVSRCAIQLPMRVISSSAPITTAAAGASVDRAI